MSGADLHAAREYATRRVNELRNEPVEILGQPVRFLNKSDGEHYAGYHFARALHDGMIDPAQAAEFARGGDPLHWHAFGLLAALEVRGDITIPEHLRGYVISTLMQRPKLKTALRRETNFFRDIAICMVVQEICDGFDLKPTSSAKHGRAAARSLA